MHSIWSFDAYSTHTHIHTHTHTHPHTHTHTYLIGFPRISNSFGGLDLDPYHFHGSGWRTYPLILIWIREKKILIRIRNTGCSYSRPPESSSTSPGKVSPLVQSPCKVTGSPVQSPCKVESLYTCRWSSLRWGRAPCRPTGSPHPAPGGGFNILYIFKGFPTNFVEIFLWKFL